MNILYLCQRVPYPPNKGEKIRTFHQIKYLCEQGHKLQLACPIHQENDIQSAQTLAKKLPVNIESTTLRAKFFRYFHGLVWRKPLSISYFFSKKLLQKINNLDSKFDLIMCSSSSMVEYYKRSKYYQKIPVIVDFMDLDSDKWLQYTAHSSFPKSYIFKRESRLLQKYEKYIQSIADSCVFTSEHEVTQFNNILGEVQNLQTIGNGIDTSFFKTCQQSFHISRPVFIFVGVMDYLPNVDAVSWFSNEIWPTIIEKYPHAKFIIAGMNPTSKVQALEKLKGVKVTGFVDDIRGYYKQANFFVAPLRIARGVQNKVLEAFACKIPVITTPNAIQGIECAPEEHVLQATTANEFIDQIERLISDADLRNEISSNALDLVRTKYSWEGQLQKLDKLIKGDLT